MARHEKRQASASVAIDARNASATMAMPLYLAVSFSNPNPASQDR